MIFVTQEGNNTEKAYFLSNLFFNKYQTEISPEELTRVSNLIFSNKSKLPQDRVAESVASTTKIIFDGILTSAVSKSSIFRKLEIHEDMAFVMLSLLCRV